MPYVERDETGRIKGVYANLQPGYAEEFLEHAVLPQPPSPADLLPLIINGLHGRLVDLEARAVATPPPVVGKEEDDGQPAASEIFDEEDLLVPSPDHGGVMIERLSDDVSIRRAQVIDRITALEEIRLEGLEDRLKARDEAIRNYNNWPAGVPMDPAVELAAQEWMQLDSLSSAISKRARDLRRSARDASPEILAAMWGNEINQGWPT